MGRRKGTGYQRAVITVSHESVRAAYIELTLQLMTDKRIKSNRDAVSALVSSLYQIVNRCNVCGVAGSLSIFRNKERNGAIDKIDVFVLEKINGFEWGSYRQATTLNVLYLKDGVSIWPEQNRKELLSWTSNGQFVPSAESLGRFFDHFATALSRTKPKSTWTVRRNRLQAKGHHR